MVSKVKDAPPCHKCESPMGEAYVLDVPVIEKNRDTGVRKHHKGFFCRDCLTTAFTIDGKNLVHSTTVKTTVKGKVTSMREKHPQGVHPRMAEIFAKLTKGIRAYKG